MVDLSSHMVFDYSCMVHLFFPASNGAWMGDAVNRGVALIQALTGEIKH